MSTQSYYTPTDQIPSYQPPRRRRGGGSSWFRICIVVIGAAVVAALVALTMTLSHSNSSTAPATGGTSTSTSASGGNQVQPSAAVVKLQQELGQLNYYEGADDGIMGPQTIAAIKDLQRDAHLPQTGVMDSATSAALANFLAHGNNQMGGNS
jgi:peptidoglycan hydrolase-like protein with peptidoglycan-binding domain